jgi:hypothetical protein
MIMRFAVALALIVALGAGSGCGGNASQQGGAVTPRIQDEPPKDSTKLKPVGVADGGAKKQAPSTSSQ